MALYIGTIILWLAAANRIVATIRRPDPARMNMTVAAVCIAMAFTVTWAIAGAAFDDLLNWPNGAELVQHLLFAGATFATLRFQLLLRLGALPRRSQLVQTALCVTVCLAMTALFAAIPLQNRSSPNFAVEYADSLAAVAYRAVFYGYLVYCLIGITVICRRNLVGFARHRRAGPDPEPMATAISVSAIAAAPRRRPSPPSPAWRQ